MKEPIWLNELHILSFHHLLILQFGGLAGVRDYDLLDSAINRPKHLYHYSQVNIFDLATSYIYGIAKNHPFNDANKRTAFITGYTFLNVNGYDLIASELEVVSQMIELVTDNITESGFTVWLKENCKKIRVHRA